MRHFIALGCFVACLPWLKAQQNWEYPPAIPDQAVANGEKWYHWADGFRWLEDESQARTRFWVQHQKDFFAAYFEGRTQVNRWRETLKPYYNYPKFGTPQEAGGFRFITYNPGLRNQPWLLKFSPGASIPDTIIDPLVWAPDGSVSMAAWSVDSSGKWLAVAKSVAGSDWRTIHVMDLRTRTWLKDSIPQVKFSGMSWAGNGFFYSRFPQDKGDLTSKNQGQQLCFHTIGTDPSTDPIVFEWPENPQMGVYGYTTPDEAWLIVSLSPGTYGNMLRAMPLNLPPEKRTMFQLTREFDYESSVVWHEGGNLYLSTNQQAPNRKLVKTKPGNQARQWEEVIPEHPQKVLESVRRWRNGWLFVYNHQVASELWYQADGANLPVQIPLPFSGTLQGLSAKAHLPHAWFGFTSYGQPPVLYRLGGPGEVPQPAQEKVQTGMGYPTSLKQVWMETSDGVQLPMYIFRRSDLPKRPGPCLLYGYGGFNISIMPFYQPWFFAFVEAGGTLAVPALRGGSEFGEAWHQAGMKHQKERVFLDLEEAAAYLIREGYTSPSWLAVHGRSNGGLLVGAVMTRRPDLFAVALPSVGVLDMMRFHKFTIGHAWRSEYGNPDDSADAAYLLSYSPLHRITSNTAYPATLVLTADHDDRVVPSHSYKFTAALQQAANTQKPVFIRIDTSAGHGAGKSIEAQIREAADILTFMESWMNPWFATRD